MPFRLRRWRGAGLLKRMNLFGNAWQASVKAGTLGLWVGLSWLGTPALAVDPAAGTNVWSYKFDYTLHYNVSESTPAVAPDGTVYAGAFDGKLHALSPDGKERWRFQAGREIKSSPAIADDGTIYFGCRDHKFYALSPAGKLKWTFDTDAWVDSSPGIARDGTVYFGSWDKNFYALNPDGSLKWKFAVGGIVDSSPAIAADGTIYFGAHDKKLYALDAAGKVRWTFATEAEITASPAIADDGSIYISSTDGNLYRLKADGTQMWRCRIGGGGNGSPVIADNGNVAIAAAMKAFIVSPEGRVVWTWGGAPVWMDGTPVVAQGTIIFPAPWRTLWAMRPDGTELWRINLKDNAIGSLVLVSPDRLYYCRPAYVEACQPPEALQPAKSTWPMFRADARHTGRVGNP